MSQESVTATAAAGDSVPIAAGRSATPTQPTVNIGSATYPPISSLLNHAGLRYPICAIQGGSLIYSPMMGQTLGQTLFPWRPFAPVATPTTPVSAAVVPNVNLVSPPTQTTPSKALSLASLMQVPSYSYMTVSSLLGGSSASTSTASEQTASTHQYTGGVPIKRENSNSPQQTTSKRPHLIQESLESHATGALVGTQNSPMPLILQPGIPIKRENNDLQQQSGIKRPRLVQDSTDAHTISMSTQNSPLPLILHSGSSTTSPTDILSYHQQQQQLLQSASLLRLGIYGANEYNMNPVNLVLIKCIGVIDSSLIEQYQIKALSLMQDLYSPSRPTAGSTSPTLPPETYILLTIDYLNSLRDGESISVELMKWAFHNALLSESHWVNYYRKHKKMTESTFVQLQFLHFVRIATYQSTSNTVVIVSQSSLSEGIMLAMQTIRKLGHQHELPKFFMVVALVQNISCEMCILVADEMQCKWLNELQQSMKPSTTKDTHLQRLTLSRDILTSMRRSQVHLGDSFLLPFFSPRGKEILSKEEVDFMLPPLSNVVEHKPIGPFNELYDVALLLLRKVLNTGHLDRYHKLDFFVICPAYPPLVSQLAKDIQESGLIQLLGIGNHRDEILQAITQRIVCCSPSSIKSMNDVIEGNRQTLYLLIVKSSHTMSCVTLNQRIMDADPLLEDNRTCDCRSILSHSNTTVVYTSAQPYSLQTSKSLIIAANEIHWTHSSTTTKQNQNSITEMSSGMEFCSILKYKSNMPSENWADIREDESYENHVLKLCKGEKTTTPICYIRAQALLSDYASALISIVKKKVSTKSMSSMSETLGVIFELVQAPMASSRGHGSMVIIRCHNRIIGTDLYNKIKVIRNTLGLAYRFEIILDHGDAKITVSEHFQRRLKSWGMPEKNAAHLSYIDLEHLPCLVIMTGRIRPSIRLPSSLTHVDLRLCHTHLTRTLFESDLSIANSYRRVSGNVVTSRRTSKQHSSVNSYKSEKHMSSSSSMVSNDGHVVEWKPNKEVSSDHPHWDKSPSCKTHFEYNNTEMDCNESSAINGGVAIVEIPQPEDHMATTFTDPVMDVEENIFDDLDSESDYDDSETEGDDVHQRKITCFLSRQYFLIWKSSSAVDQSLLLPPSDGVIWQTSNKWTHLTDHTPSMQSSYYRTWSKPEGKAKRVALDTLIKENNEGRQRSFLLTGPTQVGKTGACLLLVRLLHEYMRSCRGVAAITKTPVLLPMVRNTPLSSPMATVFSPVVSIDYLTSPHDNGTPSPFHPSTSDSKESTVLINAYPAIIHDSSHSCPKCSSIPSSSSEATPTASHVLSSLLECDSMPISVQWNIPPSKEDMIVMGSNQTLEYIKLPSSAPFHLSIPIFSVSPDLKESALLNMSHTIEDHCHVVVTKASNFTTYKDTWPSHLIAALPDHIFLGSGSCLHAVKALGQWNYTQNTVGNKQSSTISDLSPWILILDDSVCMVLKDSEEKSSVNLSTLLDELIGKENADLFSLRPWCHSSESTRIQHAQEYALDSSFLLMNLSKLGNINFNPLNFKSAAIDFHLRLLINGYSVHIPNQFTFVKKLIKPDGPLSLANLSPQLISHPDNLVTSLHHDISSLLSYPGPLLLETYLLHKSHTLFPSAHSPGHPVLMIENYINLGPKVHASLLTCDQLGEMVDHVVFGGLVLFLCEGLVASQMLHRLKFVSGACLLLITRDCKALVREVSRLDIEEYWHFKLRDEFQTSCGDEDQPLFFLTGKYTSSTTDTS